jgi:hypothetical protein
VVIVDARGPVVVWNHGPGELVAALVDPARDDPQAQRWRAEVEAALRW